MYADFAQIVSSPKDRNSISEWYNEGRGLLISPDEGDLVGRLNGEISKKYDIDFDFAGQSINGEFLGQSVRKN